MTKIKSLDEVRKIIEASRLSDHEKAEAKHELEGHGLSHAEQTGHIHTIRRKNPGGKKDRVEIEYYFSDAKHWNEWGPAEVEVSLVPFRLLE